MKSTNYHPKEREKKMNGSEKKRAKFYNYLVIDTCYLDKEKTDYKNTFVKMLSSNLPKVNEFKVMNLFGDIRGIIVSNSFGDVSYGAYKLNINNVKDKEFEDKVVYLPYCDAGHHIIIDFDEAVKQGYFIPHYVDGNEWFNTFKSSKTLEELAQDLELKKNYVYNREWITFNSQLINKKNNELKTITFSVDTNYRQKDGVCPPKITIRINDFSHLVKNFNGNWKYEVVMKNGTSFLTTETWYGWLKSLL